MTDRFLLFLLLFSHLLGSLGAQSLPLEEEPEAPEALFDQKIGDVGVVLEADGTWTTRMAAGWGQGFSPQGTFPGLGYPGMEKGGVFTQQPDFSLTLRLLERYYLEVVYGGSLEDRTFLAGYQGQSGEFVQWARAGNTPFSVPPRAGQTLAEGRRGAPAAGAAVAAGPVSLEVLGRYEDGSRESRSFLGYRDETAAVIAVDQWIRGRFFQVPPGQSPAGLRVLVADPAGVPGDDGGRYREATGAEVVVDTTTGAIRLAAEARKPYLVTWDTAGAWLGSPPPSAVLKLVPEKKVIVEGKDWVVLIRPGTPSPLEQRNRYPLPSGTSGSVTLVDRKSGTPVPGFTVGQSVVQDWFEVSGTAEAPFHETLPALYPHSSGTAGYPPPAANLLPWVFRLPAAATSKQFNLGPDILPSSVIVLRNGVPTEAFRFDGKSGTLNFDTPVFETDRIDISYQRSKSGSKASDLVVWQGGRWDTAPGQGLEWAFLGRWNMEQGRYTTEDLQSPGTMAGTVSYEGRSDGWSWRLAATAGALLTDSTGHRRLFGFAGGGTQAELNGNSLRPSAVPGSLDPAEPKLTEPNRAALVYRNYWSNDPLTGTPQVAAWGKPGVDAEPSVTDGPMGPYLVRGDGQRSDRLAVLEATMTTGQWAALQVFLDQGLPRDLKSASAVTVNVRIPNGLGPGDKVYLQAGTLGEDFDGTGALRSVEYRNVPALAFLDANRGARYFPVPESSSWGNDADKDGAAGSDGDLVTLNLTGASAQSLTASKDWQQLRFVLADEERQRLQRTTGWRLVLIKGSVAATQTVLVGPVVFEGSEWTASPASGVSGSVNPVQETDPQDKDRQQLRIDWSGRPSWSVEGRYPSFRPAAYRTLKFRYKLDAPTGTSLVKLSFTDAGGRGIRVEWPADPTTAWVQGSLDLRQHTFNLDGQPAGTVVFVPGAEAWDRAVLSKDGTSSAGTVFLAEVEASDPIWEPVGTTWATVQWKQSGAWPTEWPLVSGLTWSGTSRQSGLTQDALVWRGVTTLSGTVGPVRASAEASFLRTGAGQEGHGSYEATLPLGWAGGPRLEWTDRFSDAGLRAEKVVLVLPWVGTWEAQAQAKGPPRSLDQDYSLGWSTAPAPGWETSLTAKWSQSRPRTTALNSFAETWRDSWSWLVPPEETAPFYLVQVQQQAKAAWAPWALVLKSQSQAAQSRGTDQKWTAWGGWEVRTPFHPGGTDSYTVTPSLSKSVEAVYTGQPTLAPLESAREAAQRLWTTPGALAGIPFSEQDAGVGPWVTDAGFQTGKVQSAAGLDWERPPVSDWTDLVVPGSAGLKVAAARTQDGPVGSRSATVKANLQAKALNLFGALGSLPVFPWYRTDVWAWSTAAGWGTGTRAEDQSADGSVTLRSDLVLTTEESVGLPVAYQGRWSPAGSQSLRLQPTWTLRRPADLPFELPRWLSPSAFKRQWVQDLAVTLDLGWQPTPSPAVRDLQVSWKGRLLLSEKSELAATMRWGQQWQTNLTVVGLEAALELVLNF